MYVVILVTAGSAEEAQTIATALLEQKLAACVNIVDKIDSRFWWQGRIDSAQESLLIIKSRKDLFARVEALVKSLHSYQVPEIIAMDISLGSTDYLTWIKDNL